MLLALYNCYHITLLKATMYRRGMPQELEGYEIEAHSIIDNETVGYMCSEFVFPKLLCGVLNIVRMLTIM